MIQGQANAMPRAKLAAIFVGIVMTGALAQSAGAIVVPDGPAPPPPRAPGAVGLPAAPSRAASDAVRRVALNAYARRFGIGAVEAGRRLDLQAKAEDLQGRLLGRLGRGLSQVYFDNDAGRFVVTLGPRGSEQRARQTLAELGLKATEVKRAAHDHHELTARVAALSRRLTKVIASGHASVALVAGGVEITVAAGVTAGERAQVDAAAKASGVRVARSAKESLSVPARACRSYASGTPWASRYCDGIRGGSRYSAYAGRCTLGWWAGTYGGGEYSWFLGAGHCVTGRGAFWRTCNAARSRCYWAGREWAHRYDTQGGDNALLWVDPYAGAAREAGFTDWRNNTRQPITYYQYFPPPGALACHGGATTGISCGFVTSHNVNLPVGDVSLNHMIVAEGGPTCSQDGDSGGPVFTADLRGAIGIVSGGECHGRAVYEPIWRAIENYGKYPYGG